MAHCVHLTDDEIETLKKHNTGVSHCPTSNLDLESGLCHVKKIRDAGVKVGLGTGNLKVQYTYIVPFFMRIAIVK